MLSLFVAEAGARRVFAVEESAVHPQRHLLYHIMSILEAFIISKVTTITPVSIAMCTKVQLAMKRDFISPPSAPPPSSTSSSSPSPSTCLSTQSMVELAQQVARDNGVAATITTLQGTVTSNATLLPVVDVVLCADVSPWSVRRSLLPDVLFARSRTHTHTHTHIHTHTHTHAYTRTHTHTHTHTHARTQGPPPPERGLAAPRPLYPSSRMLP
jgi:hypothetical protein